MTNTEDESDVEVSSSEMFEKVLSKIAPLENTMTNITKTESDNAEITHLRNALVEMYEVVDSLTSTVKKVSEENDALKRKIAYYESENMSSSTISLYNKKRASFQRKRGENPAGAPGEKIKQDKNTDGQNDNRNDSDDSKNNNNTASENLTKNGKKFGPPIGHTGVSHHNKATLSSIRYFLEIITSPCCGVDIIMLHPTCKMIYDLDHNYKVQATMAIAEKAKCAKCGRVVCAETPFLDGTSLGPVLLSIIMIMFSKANTDESIADMIHGIFGFVLSDNTIYNARKAISQRLQMGMLASIMRAIQRYPHIQMDEGKYKRGDESYGYVWVVYAPVAVFVFFSSTRADVVLEVYFAWLRDKPTTCDGHQGYHKLTDTIQRDFIHILRRAEKVAVTSGDPGDEVRYDMLLLMMPKRHLHSLRLHT